jgi:hypothetical protein
MAITTIFDPITVFRDVGNVTTDLSEVEGTSSTRLGVPTTSRSKTSVLSGIAIDLAGKAGAGDGSVDTVTIDGAASNETINISTVNGAIFTTGSPATVAILNAEANDQLIVNGRGRRRYH